MTHVSTVSPSPDVARRVGAWDRLANVVIDPAAAFQGIDTHPVWAVAFAALVALRFGSLFVFYQPETNAAKVLAGVLFQVFTLMPLVAVATTLLWVTSMLWTARLTWTSAWCITMHVTFAYTLATVAIAGVAGALLPESAAVDLRNPPFTNLSFLVTGGPASVLHVLAVEADVRSGYAAVLTWLGVRAASQARGAESALIVLTCFAAATLTACCVALLR
jgi:hypothetical protein